MRATNAECAHCTNVAGYAAVTQNVVSPNMAENLLSAQLRRPFVIAIRNCEARIHRDSTLVCVKVLTCRTSDTVESSQLTD